MSQLAESGFLPRPSERRPLAFRRLHGRKLRVNVLSETPLFGLTHQGGHTAFLDCAELMSRHPDLEVEINSHRPADVLHAHSWGPLYLLRGALQRGRRIFTAHVLPETAHGALASPGIPLFHRYLAFVYDYSDVVIAVSPKMAATLAELGVRAQVRTVPNPLRGDRFQPSPALRAEGRRRLGVSDDRPLVLGVGQLQPRKGIADFARVAASTPEADFVWVGGRPFGPFSAGLSELRQLRADAPANFRFGGMFPLEQMPAIYNAADVFLFPSLNENCPYAPMEAAACGVPIVLRDLAGYRSLYDAGYLAASDTLGFTARAHELLRSRAERERAGRAARALASRFREDTYVDEMSAIYDHVACDRLKPQLRPVTDLR
jgi:1,2-diacylglycerol-3-alpha-glucose alpha-1,2-galactosyltransferase